MVAARLPLDLDPPVRQIRALLLGLDDHELIASTPCPGWTVATLLDHLMSLAEAFAQAARKGADGLGPGPPPAPSAAHLSPHWRSRLPVLLEELVTAWNDPSAWLGTARAGGVSMSAHEMGIVAAIELVVHGWDLARATGQDFAADPRVLATLIEFLAAGPLDGTPGLFGPRVPIALAEDDDLPRALALTGRDPAWRPPRSRNDPAPELHCEHPPAARSA
ncbi:TIGR03086 family metal-binding protein [Actinoplanes sp. L3-i22]|uniref:TIGR03086 family metal-binding protein n=1 Tax=Actinoplanes sp. L3-i22 TaxID=2836373 RepID=UPI001C76F20D|nr:TIGR03086 family metal-binding protein [Actinoplanes sp. L3-i22]BCY06109.1 TIGR03086 family protein [Actinoplanes sp. L3-i22]